VKRPRFDVYKAKDGWRWRLIAANGRILASGEAHPRKAGAQRAISTLIAVTGQIERERVITRMQASAATHRYEPAYVGS
jgi:uncharacterized protein YegP (UPF0339 family)